MSLETLTRILAPPPNPLYPASEADWAELEAACPLPDDYKSFVAAFGTVFFFKILSRDIEAVSFARSFALSQPAFSTNPNVE